MPTADEIEQRKRARTGRSVERTIANPGETRGSRQDEEEAPNSAEDGDTPEGKEDD